MGNTHIEEVLLCAVDTLLDFCRSLDVSEGRHQMLVKSTAEVKSILDSIRKRDRALEEQRERNLADSLWNNTENFRDSNQGLT